MKVYEQFANNMGAIMDDIDRMLIDLLVQDVVHPC
jgi:hypothetical protein